jgi:uncharacterized protein YjiS (DUF1127 family)|tara:strand:+ start:115 stop:249 length:135 start_codon:yes stop_codon:yes gene_type:complete
MIRKLWRKAVAAQERKANYWKLYHMTDRELQDIGIDRYDLKRML